MKILVAISMVPDTTTKIAFTDQNTHFNKDKVQFIINPYDEWYALVRALELKEKLGGTVTTITVGGADHEAIIRKALAIGADDAVRIDAEPSDGFFVASQIAAYAQGKSFDLILFGKETIDFNSSEVGAMTAGLLDLPFVSLANALDLEGSTAKMEREIAGGKESFTCTLPLVLSCNKGMAEARIPNMRGIMAARTKPLQVIPAIAAEVLTSISQFELQKEKAGVKLIPADNAAELIRLLHEEAKVI